MIRDEIVTRSLVGAIEKYEQTLMTRCFYTERDLITQRLTTRKDVFKSSHLLVLLQ